MAMNHDKVLEYGRRWREKNPPGVRQSVSPAAGRKYRYGLTAAAFSDLIESQDGLCDICAQEMERPEVDHDHATGRVRGLLCRGCNIGLGAFVDDSAHLRGAIEYLERAAL